LCGRDRALTHEIERPGTALVGGDAASTRTRPVLIGAAVDLADLRRLGVDIEAAGRARPGVVLG
jgi:hypothetical protein